IQPTLEFKPTPKWQLRLTPTLVDLHDPAQYLFQFADPSATHTHNARYVFASLDYTQVALETRLNYTITPGLSVQVYAQPLIASGDFGPVKELAAPNTYAFNVYGEDVGVVTGERVYPSGLASPGNSFALPRPNFNSTSLRGNAVLRWEWRPGSTMYLAWQQTRSGFGSIGDFDLNRDVDLLFGQAPDNIVVLKVSYWLNP
nr:hypothetical protein [Gemmatimonadaceae bacterium]